MQGGGCNTETHLTVFAGRHPARVSLRSPVSPCGPRVGLCRARLRCAPSHDTPHFFDRPSSEQDTETSASSLRRVYSRGLAVLWGRQQQRQTTPVRWAAGSHAQRCLASALRRCTHAEVGSLVQSAQGVGGGIWGVTDNGGSVYNQTTTGRAAGAPVAADTEGRSAPAGAALRSSAQLCAASTALRSSAQPPQLCAAPSIYEGAPRVAIRVAIEPI